MLRASVIYDFPDPLDLLASLDMSDAGLYELCGRKVPGLTRHQLIPRARHSNKRNNSRFTRVEVKKRITWSYH